MNPDAVRAYYESFGEKEWARLTSPEGAIEFAVNCHFISAHLPPAARVLDIGGGPGRYAIWLAEQGHHVVLADLSPTLLAIAREKIAASNSADRIEAVVEADARDLSRWPDASFDAILCLGPFYHLTEEADRNRAAAELARILRPGGVAFVALLSRYTFLRRVIVEPDETRHLAGPGFISRVLDNGTFINDIPGRFTEGYGVHPPEVAPFFKRHGFTTLDLIASKGIATGLEESVAQLATTQPALFEKTLELIIRTANDPSILGICSHLLYIGVKRSAGAR